MKLKTISKSLLFVIYYMGNRSLCMLDVDFTEKLRWKSPPNPPILACFSFLEKSNLVANILNPEFPPSSLQTPSLLRKTHKHG